MTERASGSYVADVKYHGFLIAESSPVVNLTTTKGFIRLDETMPVGTLLQLKFKRVGESEPTPVGPLVSAQVNHVEEVSSKDREGTSGIEVEIPEGDGRDFLEQLLTGSWEEPEGGVPDPEPAEQEPIATAVPFTPPVAEKFDGATEEMHAEALPPMQPPAAEPPAEEIEPEPPADELQAEAQPADEPPPAEELPPIEAQPPEGQDPAYQKAGTIQGVPVMDVPEEDNETEKKKGKSKKKKRAKKGRKKKGT